MTSSTWKRVRSTDGIHAHAAPPTAPAMSSTRGADHPSVLPHVSPTAAAAVAPASNCPSAPMLKTPPRNAIATARPVRIRGVDRTSVADVKAYHEPNALLHSAAPARGTSY